MTQRQVKTSREHIQSLAKATPLQAVEELIWNGLDAGGSTVEVKLHESTSKMGSLEAIEVIDHGIGIPSAELDAAFGEIGNSRKPAIKVNGDGRAFHGREGRGRLKALSICQQPEWETTYRGNGKLRRYVIRIHRNTPDFFDVGDEAVVGTATTGTTVKLWYVDEACDSLLRPDLREVLTRRFALYLSEYPGTQIILDGTALSVDGLIEHKQTYDLPPAKDGGPPIGAVTVIEWAFKLDSRKLYLCSESGFSFHDMPLKLQAPGMNYTAYFRSEQVTDWADTGRLTTGELDQQVSNVLDLVRQKIKAHIRERQSEAVKDIVEEWKEQKVYPYRDDEPKTPLIEMERQVFDIVAVQVDSLHPTFRETDLENKKLTLALIRRAMEGNPSNILTLLSSFLDLDECEQQDFVDLLQRTSLSALIQAGTIVTQRLDTIQAFSHLLYSDEWRDKLLERTQLHRLLRHEMWILGEEFQVATDDESLATVLKKHIELLGRREAASDADVRLINGKDGIPDLMLWHKQVVDRSRFEHLVVELKRPSKVGSAEITQIENYAFTVTADEAFNTDKVRWRFVLLANDLDAYAIRKASNDKLPPGCIHSDGNVTIWVQRWSDVLEAAKLRYEFFRDRLDVQASKDEGMKLLKSRYDHLLTGRGSRKKKDMETMAAKATKGKATAVPK